MSYKCNVCSTAFTKWLGQCSNCKNWNSLEEIEKKGETTNIIQISFEYLEEHYVPEKIKTNLQEFDRTIGGGLVSGGVILISGDPGIGKSTLLLQLTNSDFGQKCSIYISGEESINQLKDRAKRLQITNPKLKISSCNNLEEILNNVEKFAQETQLLIIDSIQTIQSNKLEGAAGNPTQIKYCAQKLIEFAKAKDVTLIIVGHITKEGMIAGPKILEHSVDTVLYFEGERNHIFRILRAVKNRFGPTDEMGIFEIHETGLKEVLNPSLMFLNQQQPNATGSIIFPNFEGTRPLMIEIQALVANSVLQMPRRAVIGWDTTRLPMICAVLEKHCNVFLSNKDVYLNVVNGIKITEPAADLAVLLAIASSHFNIPLPTSVIAFGEIGLSGEIRNVQNAQKRIDEALKLNCEGIICHETNSEAKNITKFKHVKEAIIWVKKLKKPD